MTKNIFSVAIMVVVMAGSFAVASDDICNAEKIESKTFLIQKEREYQQALTQLEALKRQADTGAGILGPGMQTLKDGKNPLVEFRSDTNAVIGNRKLVRVITEQFTYHLKKNNFLPLG